MPGDPEISSFPYYDVAVIGAGAAGLAAAIFAAEEQKRRAHRGSIVLIDGAKKPGAKILVSGGGRCNVTNAVVTPEDYCGGSPKIIRNVLRRFSEADTVRWMDELGVELKEEPHGKLFPVTDKARTVLDALMGRVRQLDVESRFGFRVADLQRESDAAGWRIRSQTDGTLRARRVIMATGGKALPKSGSDGAGYDWLRRLGHTIVPPVPALAPLILDERGVDGSPVSRHFADLSGIAINARLAFVPRPGAAPIATIAGSLLFTHFGLSGPAAMNLSRHIARHRLDHPGERGEVHLRFEVAGPGGTATFESTDAWLQRTIANSPRTNITTLLGRSLPERLALMLAASVDAERLGDLTRDQRKHLARLLHGSPLSVKGDRGYAFAEATAGGVALNEIDWRTMASRKAAGLYLCGEVLDVDGRIGGFNFQWAWASGHIAGIAAADMASAFCQ